MVMCVKVGQSFVLKHILEYGDFAGAPEQMSIDMDTKVFYKQYDIDYRATETERPCTRPTSSS